MMGGQGQSPLTLAPTVQRLPEKWQKGLEPAHNKDFQPIRRFQVGEGAEPDGSVIFWQCCDLVWNRWYNFYIFSGKKILPQGKYSHRPTTVTHDNI